MEILDVYNDFGTVHDFKMFKESLLDILPKDIFILADLGYQGINKYFKNAILPFKASKNNPLSKEQKAFNTKVSKCRVAIEHINREIKIFRICKKLTEVRVDEGY